MTAFEAYQADLQDLEDIYWDDQRGRLTDWGQHEALHMHAALHQVGYDASVDEFYEALYAAKDACSHCQEWMND